jgi:hypothetical protein
MPGEIRVYFNDRGHQLPEGASVRDAIAALAPDLLPVCEAGQAVVTDARGIAVPLEAPLQMGDILRAARSSRRAPSAADGHAGA